MKNKNTPRAVTAQYNKAQAYNTNIDLYNRVRQNENFFIGNQWEGVNAPDLDKPVFNILKRVVLFFVSSIVSDDISADLSLFGQASPEQEQALRLIRQQVEKVIEKCKVKDKNRTAIRNAAVDGDACFYLTFDPDAESGSELTSGDIDVEIIDNTNIYFGNPEVQDVQKQPYILLMMRRDLDTLKDELKGKGIAQNVLDALRADDDPNGVNREREEGKITVITKLWKENGTVWVTQVASNETIKKPTNTGYRLYPVAYMSWDTIKNSYHGQAAVTGLISNQIFVNKLFAMSMEHMKKMAFPKVIYNKALFPDGFSNKVGEAVGAVGDPNMAVMQNVRAADMSGQVMQLIERTIDYTRDMMGASDASLGNVRPENTSAIIAVQKASSMPLELNKMAFYQFVEDYIRVMIEIMRVNYGLRMVRFEDEIGNVGDVLFDFSMIDSFKMSLNVNIGAAAYWSELMQVQTLDNLFAKGIITDAITYLESIPDGYIRNKGQIIDDIRKKQEQMMMQQAMMGGMQNALPAM